MTLKRGAFIVIEGMDRTGKSTQAKKLVQNFKSKQLQAEYMNFPARHTEIGGVINSYLTSQKDLPDEVIHLLFSANRWEQAKQITMLLKKGVNVIVDRYCYSGVAFSSAKGLDVSWCKSSDVGLPQPDKVFFLTMPLENVQQRDGFGNERYEVVDFQEKVSQVFMQLKDNLWEVVNADRSISDIEKELLGQSLITVDEVCTKPIRKIWCDK